MVSRLRWRQYQGAEEKGVVLGKLKPFEPNSIVVGDCLEVMARMPDRCVDLVVTDPPYGLKIARRSKNYGTRTELSRKGHWR